MSVLLFENSIYWRFCVHPLFRLASSTLIVLRRFPISGALSLVLLLLASFKLCTYSFISSLELLRSLFTNLTYKSAFGFLALFALECKLIDNFFYFILFFFQFEFYFFGYLQALFLFWLKWFLDLFHLIFTSETFLNFCTHQSAGALGVAFDFIWDRAQVIKLVVLFGNHSIL